MEIEILRLKLAAPLFYVPAGGIAAFGGGTEYIPGGETLFCFEPDESQRLSFEPDADKLLQRLVFAGKLPGEAEKHAETFFELPRGDYLFTQMRKITGREESAAMARELQQEALWQRLLPGERLYLRCLFEDGGFVTQLWRPYTETNQSRRASTI